MNCIACAQAEVRPLIDLGSTPALVGVFWPDEKSARAAARGLMQLAACPYCGHTVNQAFDERLIEYDGRYDNSLHFSPTFQGYAHALARRLVETYDVRGGHVVEIGSGKGEFLREMATLGGNSATGFDPSYEGSSDHPSITFVRDYFRAAATIGTFDLLVSRHVLEHVTDPYSLLRELRSAASGGDEIYYFEVPWAGFDFGPAGLWDLIYPHVSYFSRASLIRLVERSGFAVVNAGLAFDDEFLYVEAKPAGPGAELTPIDQGELARHLDLLANFPSRLAAATKRWRQRMDAISHSDRPAAFWGVGSKGVNFLNVIDPSRRFWAVVDLNPNKWGMFVPGTGHEIASPKSLAGSHVATIVITNGVYRDEVAAQAAALGLSADIEVV